jgi:hypothetical protein
MSTMFVGPRLATVIPFPSGTVAVRLPLDCLQALTNALTDSAVLWHFNAGILGKPEYWIGQAEQAETCLKIIRRLFPLTQAPPLP